MNADMAATEKAKERFARHIEARGMRKTPERFAILERAMAMPGHFSSDFLYARLEEEGYHVSRSTVYKTLEILCDCGLVRRHLLQTRGAGYEVARSNHCHLICTHCGKIEERDGEEEILQKLKEMETGGFRPDYVSASIYGLCSQCAAKLPDKEVQTPKKEQTKP